MAKKKEKDSHQKQTKSGKAKDELVNKKDKKKDESERKVSATGDENSTSQEYDQSAGNNHNSEEETLAGSDKSYVMVGEMGNNQKLDDQQSASHNSIDSDSSSTAPIIETSSETKAQTSDNDQTEPSAAAVTKTATARDIEEKQELPLNEADAQKSLQIKLKNQTTSPKDDKNTSRSSDLVENKQIEIKRQIDKSTEAEESPVIEAEESPVTEAEESPVIEAEESPVTEAEESPVTEAEESPVTEAEESPVTELVDEKKSAVTFELIQEPQDLKKGELEQVRTSKSEFNLTELLKKKFDDLNFEEVKWILEHDRIISKKKKRRYTNIMNLLDSKKDAHGNKPGDAISDTLSDPADVAISGVTRQERQSVRRGKLATVGHLMMQLIVAGFWRSQLGLGFNSLKLEFVSDLSIESLASAAQNFGECSFYEVNKQKKTNSIIRYQIFSVAALLICIVCYLTCNYTISCTFFAVTLTSLTSVILSRVFPEPARAEIERSTINHAPINKKNGLYKISVKFLWFRQCRGVGYLQDGTLYTRYAVTRGASVAFDDGLRQPCLSNYVGDNVAYGREPNYMRVCHNDELVVILADRVSGQCSAAYKCVANCTFDKLMLFKGLRRSSFHANGSPVFKFDAVEGKYRFAGSVGWYWPRMESCCLFKRPQRPLSDEVGTDANTESASSVVGCATTIETIVDENDSASGEIKFKMFETMQTFLYSGAGKTTRVLPGLVADGLKKFGRVYVACGHQKLVDKVHALLEARSSKKDELKLILIDTHDAMLDSIISNNKNVEKPGLWILDDADKSERKTLILKDILRSRVGKSGALVELLAAGYQLESGTFVAQKYSNYPIEDITMAADEMLVNMIREAVDKKVVVFVSAIDGEAPDTAESIEQLAEGKKLKIIMLSSSNSSDDFETARKLDTGLVLTTEVSENGIDLDADVVYDLRLVSRFVAEVKHIKRKTLTVDFSQAARRRGRVGRIKPGRYVSSATREPTKWPERRTADHHDRFVFARSFGIRIEDDTILSKPKVKLTHAQLRVWLTAGNGYQCTDAINSPHLIKLLFNDEGALRQREEVESNIRSWADVKDVVVKNGKTVKCDFWDERDETIFNELTSFIQSNGKNNLTKLLKRAENLARFVELK